MEGSVARLLQAEVKPTGETVTIHVKSSRLDRVDAYVDDRPVGSENVDADRCTFVVPRTMIGPGGRLRLEGFEGGTLEAARRSVIPPA